MQALANMMAHRDELGWDNHAPLCLLVYICCSHPLISCCRPTFESILQRLTEMRQSLPPGPTPPFQPYSVLLDVSSRPPDMKAKSISRKLGGSRKGSGSPLGASRSMHTKLSPLAPVVEGDVDAITLNEAEPEDVPPSS